MSLLHSFYCWGHVGVVLLSTLFFAVFGIENWKILSFIWAVIPIFNAVLLYKSHFDLYVFVLFCKAEHDCLFTKTPLAPLIYFRRRKGNDPQRACKKQNVLGTHAHDGMLGRKRTGCEPMGFRLCRAGAWNQSARQRATLQVPSHGIRNPYGRFKSLLREIR